MPPCLKLLTAALATLAVALPVPLEAQEAEPLLSLDDFETVFYVPKHTHALELTDLVQRIYGRDVYVTERGGYEGPPVQNLQVLGDALLIYDEPAYTRRMLAWLESVDRPVGAEGLPEPVEVTHWSPGFVSLATAYQALEPFLQTLAVPASQRNQRVVNVTMLPEQGVLVLRDTPTQLAQMLALLREIDQPEAQLLVTAMVISGHHEAGDSSGLPEELTRHLARLVPFEHFSLRSMGMVRTSSRSRSIELEMETHDEFGLRPDAFDGDSAVLSALVRFRSSADFGFETRTSIKAGEYVVLGSSGAEPTFAVLKIEVLED